MRKGGFRGAGGGGHGRQAVSFIHNARSGTGLALGRKSMNRPGSGRWLGGGRECCCFLFGLSASPNSVCRWNLRGRAKLVGQDQRVWNELAAGEDTYGEVDQLTGVLKREWEEGRAAAAARKSSKSGKQGRVRSLQPRASISQSSSRVTQTAIIATPMLLRY